MLLLLPLVTINFVIVTISSLKRCDVNSSNTIMYLLLLQLQST